jgi:hypothetical protein
VHHKSLIELRAPCMQQEEAILNLLSDEFWGLYGGIATRWGAQGTEKMSLWTEEDQVRPMHLLSPLRLHS